MKDFDGKELKLKIFKLKHADMSKKNEKKLFETIFDHALIKLADKLINTINKNGNQIIANDFYKHKDKLFKKR